MSNTQSERRHVRREATLTGEQRDSLLVVEALAAAAVDAGLLTHSLTEEEKTRALQNLREVVRAWDRNIATHEYWDEAGDDWMNVWQKTVWDEASQAWVTEFRIPPPVVE